MLGTDLVPTFPKSEKKLCFFDIQHDSTFLFSNYRKGGRGKRRRAQDK
jgi:hypothetical protein